ncbi:PAS domain-containing protein [Virgisporangium ochraceum]
MALPDGMTSVIEAVVALFHPHLEAVVHDVAADEVVAIWNPVSGRRPGDASLLEPDLIEAGAGVLGPYGKVDAQGRTWTSVTVPLDDGATLLCLNFDRSVLDRAAGALTAYAAPVRPRPAGLFERDWREEINQLVDGWCRSSLTPRDLLTAAQRRELVAHLDGKGVFGVRHSARHVAAALGVSRATVYGMLKACRD